MDFIILKVNGTDVSSSPHADAVREFLTAKEPIIVEVIRRSSVNKTLCTCSNISEKDVFSDVQSSDCNVTSISDINAQNEIIDHSQCPIHTFPLSSENKDDATENSSGPNIEDSIKNQDAVAIDNCIQENIENPFIVNLEHGLNISDDTYLESTNEKAEQDLEEYTKDSHIYCNQINSYGKLNVYNKSSDESANGSVKAVNNDSFIEQENGLDDGVSDLETINARLTSRSVQTFITGMNWFDDLDCSTFENLQEMQDFDEILLNDIKIEEVTLRKSKSSERLGLTVSYAGGIGSSESTEAGGDVDTCSGGGSSDCEETPSEVYISDITPDSIAYRDGRLKHGDQILQVNGKDVASKEETESLFAENKNAVTLLVSRCIFPNKLDSPETILQSDELLQQLSDQNFTTMKKPVTPTEAFPSINLEQKNIDRFLGRPVTNTFVRNQIESINKEIALLDCRMHNIHIVNKDKVVNSELSDIEHIYETIPESNDSEVEPIYSSPYEPTKELSKSSLVLTSQNYHEHHECNRHRRKCKKEENVNMSQGLVERQRKQKTNGKSTSSGGSGDSSSAYNTGTGGSCNSNLTAQCQFPFTLKLNCKESNRSMLQLCPSSVDWNHIIKNETNGKSANGIDRQSQSHILRHSCVTQNASMMPVIPADTMYTNMANLHQTMLLQQQLFRQAMCRREMMAGPTNSFTSPSLSQYQFNKQQVYKCNHNEKQFNNDTELKMEWKVKRRQDGTRYITRRPIRKQIMLNRAKEILEERAGATTEDEKQSELKVGRYWTKEERKKQIEKRHRVQDMTSGEMYKKCSKHTNDVGVDNNTEYHPRWAKPNTDKMLSNVSSSTVTQTLKKSADKKTLRKKNSHKDSQTTGDNFVTVQDILVHGNRLNNTSSGKMIGLLSVTTV